jgi:hypothetical protein
LNKRWNKKISLSFFQAPALYLEHLRRNRTNSFKSFLNQIYESAPHFPEWKLKNASFYKYTSIRLDLLEPVYLEFCTKEGLKPKTIEEELKILNEFNLKLEWKIDNTTDAYKNIRWKSPLEKIDEAVSTKLASKKNKTENLITQFLLAECRKSTFDKDFILTNELKEKYDSFCAEKNIDPLLKLNIIGCSEMEKFGAKFDKNLYIPYISGLAFVKIPGMKQTHYIPGMIRIPKESKARKRNVGFFTKTKNRIVFFLFSSEGIITNALIVAIHSLMLIGLPVLLVIACGWSLLQINIINQDIYAVVYNIYDLFNASSYEFWLDDVSGAYIFMGVSAFWGLFFITGFVELLSFYATGARDTGKFIVSKSWCKWFSTISFWIMLASMLSVYIAYVSVVLVWCILGAVLNPEKFLPMAVGAVVLIGFWALLYTRVKKVDASLKGVVSGSVDTELKLSLAETIRKEQQKLQKQKNPPVEQTTRVQFSRAINTYMVNKNYPPVKTENWDAILDGNIGVLKEMLSNNLGIESNIAMAIIGFIKGDTGMMLAAIQCLAMELNMDPELTTTIAEISLDKYNPDTVGINKAQGTVILSLK